MKAASLRDHLKEYYAGCTLPPATLGRLRSFAEVPGKERRSGGRRTGRQGSSRLVTVAVTGHVAAGLAIVLAPFPARAATDFEARPIVANFVELAAEAPGRSSQALDGRRECNDLSSARIRMTGGRYRVMDDPSLETGITVSETAIFPSQFFQSSLRSVANGERRLLAAVLEDAMHSFWRTAGSTRPRERRLHWEAAEWIFSDDRSCLMSFISICEILGLDVVWLRQMASDGRPVRMLRR